MSEQQVTPSLRPLLAVAFLAATTMAVAGPGMPAWASDRDGDIVSRTEEGGGLVPLSDSELIYVRHDATGANDGSSWEDAFTTLQAALDAAGFDDEIWVAAGTYKPTHDYGLDIGPRGRHFRLRNTVEIYGGFAGTETAREQRDWQANLTVLSGDIGVEGDTSDNCYHVFFHPSEAPYVNDTAVLDGFAITGGNADGDWPHSGGGGMFNHASSPSVANCTFSGNSAGRGGGMYNYNFSDANIVNSTFSGNTATEVGGGTYNYQSAPTVTNGAFSGNEANSGGGMANLNFSSPTVTNCIFSENSTDAGDGGGMYNTRSDATVTESTFSGNSAGERGGAMHNSSCSPTVTNCAFTDNSAATYGGAMFNYEAGPGVTNCTFSGNEANSGGGMHNAWVSSPSITNCTFTRNAATNGPALACHSEGSEQPSSVTVLNSIVYDGMDAIWNGDESKITINHSAVPPGWSGKENIHENPRFVDAEAGNLRLQAISPCIDAGNNSHLPEGVTTDLDGNPRIVNRTVDMGAYEFQGQSSHLIAGLNDAGGIFRREGVTAGAPAGTDWDRIPGFLTQLSAGTGALWGVNENGGVFVRTGITPDTPNGTAWERADGTLAQVSAGESGVVWGLNASGGIFVREGVTDGNPTGTGWDRVPGRLAHVAAGVGSVWGLNEAGGIFVRTGVTGDTPKGTAWEQVPGRLADVSVGDTGLVWGLNEAGGIFVRTGVTADEPAGTGWDRVPGRLSQVTAGFDVVWGLNENGGIFAREGVTADTPEGSDWSRVAGTLAQVTAGLLEPQTTSLEVKDTADGDSKTLTESTLSTSPSRDAEGGSSIEGPGEEDLLASGGDPAHTAAPRIAITGPTGTVSDSLAVVRGTVEEEGAVRGVWVNGVRAVATGANYATWQAVAPLSQGRSADDPDAHNTLTVGAADAAGNYAETTAAVVSVGEAGRVRKVGLDTVYRGCLVEGDVDTFQFEATAGTSVSITLDGAGSLELRDPWGDAIDLDGESLTLAATGLYSLRVLPEGEGAYELSIDGTVPRSVVRTTATLSGPSDEDAYAVCSVAGGVLSARAQGEFGPARIAVLDPAGRTVAEADSLLRGLLLPVTGDYSVVVSGPAGDYDLVCSVTPPQTEEQRLQGADLLRVEAADGLIELTVVGAEDDPADNVVLIGGEMVEPEGGSLSGGRGLLRARMPADQPAGESEISFIADGEQSESVSIQVAP